MYFKPQTRVGVNDAAIQNCALFELSLRMCAVGRDKRVGMETNVDNVIFIKKPALGEFW